MFEAKDLREFASILDGLDSARGGMKWTFATDPDDSDLLFGVFSSSDLRGGCGVGFQINISRRIEEDSPSGYTYTAKIHFDPIGKNEETAGAAVRSVFEALDLAFKFSKGEE